MSSEERPDSLAAQAASWVPPWERKREPDREYQAAAEAEAEEIAAADEEVAAEAEQVTAQAEQAAAEAEEAVADAEQAVAEAREAAGAVASIVAVDAPHELEDDDEDEGPEPTEDEVGPELPLPEPIEEAAEAPEKDEPEGDAPVPVDAPSDHVPAPAFASVPVQARGSRDDLDEEDGFGRTSEVSLDDAELAAALESIMLVVDEPVAELQLAQVLEQPVERVARTLENISARYTGAGHGIDLRRAAGGWRLYTRPEYAPYVERFVLDGQSVRLTQAALETLSVVAYKQPVTRSRISAIRGVNCDGVMRTLVTRGLIEECGTEPETGAYLYRTTVLFLEKLGLNSVDQLPPLAPFLPDDVEEVLDASG
ncbi:SMC-Scp complex subunit ScpB [Actinoplanes sp. GCM10030250]|uniref:SMC-Scp complex subunit ScpB n=1 Tax=Actinoplanes sp. GCM10030250 TaxID=3273376 RepID=UPI00362218A7